MKFIMGWLGFVACYPYQGRDYSARYEAIDSSMGRPLHEGMSVAPPGTKRRWKRAQ